MTLYFWHVLQVSGSVPSASSRDSASPRARTGWRAPSCSSCTRVPSTSSAASRPTPCTMRNWSGQSAHTGLNQTQLKMTKPQVLGVRVATQKMYVSKNYYAYCICPARHMPLRILPSTWCVCVCVSTIYSYVCLCIIFTHSDTTPQWGAADAEIKAPSGENTELKRSPFIAWSRSVYSHTCYAYCQGVLPCLLLPFQSIHLHFFRNLSRFFPVLALANTGSCVGPQNEIGHPAGCRFPCWIPAEYK